LTVRGCFRSQEKADAFELPPLLSDKVSFESKTGVDATDIESLKIALKDCDRAVLVTPLDYSAGMQNDADNSINMIRAAKEMGVSRIVHIGSWTVNAPERLPILSSRFKPTEDYLLDEIGDAMEWTVLRGGYFMANFLHHAASIKEMNELMPCPDVSLPPIDTRDIGEAAAALVGGDHDGNGGYSFHKEFIECCGPQVLSHGQIAAELSKGLGRTIAYPAPLDLDAFCEGNNPIIVELFRYMTDKEATGIPSDPTKLTKVLGRPPSTLRQWAKDHKAAFTA
jgi:uncharacterized protein YbjT (DUF2867 family)